MNIFQTTVILLTTMGISLQANAGNLARPGAYQVENQVKVYRHGPSQAQMRADQMRYQYALQMKRQEARNKAFLQQQQQAQQAAFERGFTQGLKQGQTEQRPNQIPKRSRYGRRYTTAFYGTQFGSYNRPLHLRYRTN